MPLTFPSHLAPVLPLKLWRPRWFDGVALAAGAVAPDVAYLALDDDGRLFADTHAWPALLWWCLPVAAAYTWVARRSIGTIAAHLPDSRRFTWQAYAALAGHRHRWWITVLSCLLGAASHLAWDRLTHTDGWIQAVFGVRWADVSPIAWWTVSDLASTVLGAAVVLAVAARAGRRSGRERAATGPTTGAAARGGARPAETRPRIFWSALAVAALVGLAVVPSLPGAGLPAATGVRLLHVAAGALLVGVLCVRIAVRRAAGA
ncbi:DUF4184 family protein [Catellatospora coxensis]|uniref:DUF4184 family protein n=1 Tax=Catellatospora coxensis TaxID=310354 RepID=A0A8J3KTT8_9ACTN|nr:DUF4184 family protein [Catellatospora coxensis]GIG04979.1 hypothetical protein Cco03nite_16790 [Catellatospora coxensis]